MSTFSLLPIDADASEDRARAVVRDWAAEFVPAEWRQAAASGGPTEVRRVRSRAEYEAWYPTFANAGLVVPMWPRDYGGLGVKSRVARAVDAELAPLNLGRLNVLGLNLAGTDDPGVGNGGAEGALPAADRAQRGDLVPALQRAGRGVGPRVARDARHARR